MRNLFLLMFLLHISIITTAQKDFKWDIKVDSLVSNKDELYSKTKVFIAERWPKAKNIIQDDDREAGIIVIKDDFITQILFQKGIYYTFTYTVKFYQKENKCRIVLDDVKHKSTLIGSTYSARDVPVADKYPSENGKSITSLNESNYYQIMARMKTYLQAIVDSYILNIKKPSIEKADW